MYPWHACGRNFNQSKPTIPKAYLSVESIVLEGQETFKERAVYVPRKSLLVGTLFNHSNSSLKFALISNTQESEETILDVDSSSGSVVRIQQVLPQIRGNYILYLSGKDSVMEYEVQQFLHS